MFRSKTHDLLPDRFVFHAKIDKNILPFFPDLRINVPVKPGAFGPEIAHLAIQSFDEFRRGDFRSREALLDDPLEGRRKAKTSETDPHHFAFRDPARERFD